MSHDVIVHFPVNFISSQAAQTLYMNKHLKGVGFMYCVLGVLESEQNSSRNCFMNTVAVFLQELLLETKGSFSTKLKDVLDRKFVKRTIIDHFGGI